MICRVVILHIVVISALYVISTEASSYPCKMSNEGCDGDEDGDSCCSKQCQRAHEGTNYRCLQSHMGQRCYADFQCLGNMECGPHYNCCAPYWGDCMADYHCCEGKYRCIRTVGFTYKKCLEPIGINGASDVTTDPVVFLTLFMVAVVSNLRSGVEILTS